MRAVRIENRELAARTMRDVVASRRGEPRPVNFVRPLLLVLLVLVTGVRGLSNVSIDIPLAVAAGSTVNMTCRYDLQSDTLYTVKWSKGREFFRYVPKEMPPIAVFGALGDKVLTNRSDAHRMVLQDVQPDHSGRYRCEVTSDLPTINSVVVFGYMHVASLPKGDPEISVEKLRYAPGDTVKANCTVPSANPPANITWTVNGNPVNSSFVMNMTDKLIDNQHIAIASLDFETIPDSFSNGKLHVVCHASVFNLYERKAEVWLIEERPKIASVLGTRESAYIDSAAKRAEEWFYVGAAAALVLCNLR